MLTPGRNYPGTQQRLTMAYTDQNGDAVDPSTVTFELMDPEGVLSTYVYGTDSEIDKSSTGNFYCDVIPDMGGRWFFRWKATGTGKILNEEGFISIQASPFVDYYGTTDYT